MMVSINDSNFKKTGQLVREAVKIFMEKSSTARDMRNFLDVHCWSEEAE